MKTVFFNNFPINLVTDINYQSERHFFHSKDIDVPSIIDKMEEGVLEAVFIYNEDFNSLWQHFTTSFKIIEAGGGKVFNDKNEVLFIFRNDKWDLPKGKIEKGETIEEAAIREVEEETGVEKLKISEQLETTFHIYKHKKKYVLKVSYWFKMTSDFKGELFPQLEEGITKVVWLSDAEAEKALQNTYNNIKLLF